jgi:hypothetical protein
VKPQAQDLVTGTAFNFGRFAAPFRRVNPLDAEPLAPLRVPVLLKDFRLKEWQAFQFANERFFVNVALFNAKWIGLVQIKVYDRAERRKTLFERRVSPLAFRAPADLLDSEMAYEGRGCRMRFRNQLEKDRIGIEFDADPGAGRPALSGRLTALFQGQEPLVVAIPFGRNHGMYSHKGLVPVEGEMSVGAVQSRFRAGEACLLIDDHRGYYPWTMRWDWVTGARPLGDGRIFGFNLTRNDSIDPERYNENAFWLGGRCQRLPAVSFTRSVEGGQELWAVRDREGRVQVDFTVEVEGDVHVNALVVRSKYRGPFGSFRGHVVGEDGVRHPVDGIFGMGEDFHLRG